MIFLYKIEIQGQFIFTIFCSDYFFLLKTAFLIFEILRRQKMKKYNPHSNRIRSSLVPAPKSSKPLIVAAGNIRAGTVILSDNIFVLLVAIPKHYLFASCTCIEPPALTTGDVTNCKSCFN